MRLIWSLIWRLQVLARFLIIQLLGKCFNQEWTPSRSTVANTISAAAHWIMGTSLFVGFTLRRTRSEKTQLHFLSFLFKKLS
jgi:hypothetical protein